MNGAPRLSLAVLHERLLAYYGDQRWWPGEGPFEVMAGAILTQNTAWRNVEKALTNLRLARALDPAAMRRLPRDELARLIRPSGYFNLKARRLRNFCRWYLDCGGFDALGRLPTQVLRRRLLGVNGIGPETADDILLYAFDRPVFVVDAYTRRLMSRTGLNDSAAGYAELQGWFHSLLGRDSDLFKAYHALIVTHGKTICTRRPRCEACFLYAECARNA